MESDEHSNSSDSEHEQDEERLAIKEELSTLSFEDLQKLKERVGAKVYKQAILAGKKEVRDVPKDFKRENKNRPREMSSKKPVSMLQRVPKKKSEIRDPRFDPLCGIFDQREFSANYGFLSKLRINDINAIREELKTTIDPEKEQRLRRLLQRLKDKQKASKKKTRERETLQKQKSGDEADFSSGTHPHFKNKSELRVESLVKQYEELKQRGNGRIQKHIERRQQKIKKRSFRNQLPDN